MKNLSIAIVLLASRGATSSSSDAILGQVKEKLFAAPSSHSRSRMLQLSDACIAANEALAQDPIFIAAMQEAKSSCPQAYTMTENSMSVDFSVCPDIKDDFVEVCDAVNGTSVPVEKIVIDCKIEGESFTITRDKLVECLDAVCDASQYGEHIAGLNENAELQDLLCQLSSILAKDTFSGAYHIGVCAGMFAVVVATAGALFV